MNFEKGFRIQTKLPFSVGGWSIPAGSVGTVTRGSHIEGYGEDQWIAVEARFDFNGVVYSLPEEGITYANVLERLAWET